MRVDGYADIRDYAVIGDGRTAALVAKDGAIDWLCLPNFDVPTVFAAALDAQRGGALVLQPAIPFDSSRRYLPGTNVLETVFATDRGSVRVVDAMTLPDDWLGPMREIARSVEGLSGTVPMRWHFAPRFNYGAGEPRCEWRADIPTATYGSEAVAVRSWDAGTPVWRSGTAEAEFEMRAGVRALLAVASAHGEPLVVPSRSAVERRLERTIQFWQSWAADRDREYAGPWRDGV